MNRKFRCFYLVLALPAILMLKWNCIDGRHPPEIVEKDNDSGRSANAPDGTTNAVSDVSAGPVLDGSNGKKTRRTYRGISLTELVSLPWTPQKALEAQHEPWWGQPFDSAAFWEGRPIWLDYETKSLAMRRGRRHPPVPPQFASGKKQRVLVSDSSTIECRMPRMYYTEEESRFWNAFSRTHPQPPEEIERWLQHWSELRVRAEKFGIPPLPSGKELKTPGYLNRKEPRDTVDFARSEASSVSMPAEAVTEDALYWEYVRGKRIEYEKEVENRRTNGTGVKLESFFHRLECPSELVRKPPSDEEIRVTIGWRIAYIRRLRREGTDESYIEAYKKAWNLSEDDLREKPE